MFSYGGVALAQCFCYPVANIMSCDYDHQCNQQVFSNHRPRFLLLCFGEIETETGQERKSPDDADDDGCCELKEQNGDDKCACEHELGSKSADC